MRVNAKLISPYFCSISGPRTVADKEDVKIIAEHSTTDQDNGTETKGKVQEGDETKPVANSMENQEKMLTCFFRRMNHEGKEYVFIYVKRNGKIVNFNVTRIPWLIQRLSYYYSIVGEDMTKLEEALGNCCSTVESAKAQLNVDEMDI